MRVLMSDGNKIGNGSLTAIMKDLEYIGRCIYAIKFHMGTIEESEEVDVIMISVDAMEEIFPGTKEAIKNKEEAFASISDKCISLGAV